METARADPAFALFQGGPDEVETIGGALAILRSTLKARLLQARRDFADGATQSQCVNLVAACRERLQTPVAANDETSLAGLRKIYRKARETFAEVEKRWR
jgi:hypothetical protein